MEVVQYLKDKYHEGKCEVAVIDDGKLVAEADSGEFWGLFGGFAPIKKGQSRCSRYRQRIWVSTCPWCNKATWLGIQIPIDEHNCIILLVSKLM